MTAGPRAGRRRHRSASSPVAGQPSGFGVYIDALASGASSPPSRDQHGSVRSAREREIEQSRRRNILRMRLLEVFRKRVEIVGSASWLTLRLNHHGPRVPGGHTLVPVQRGQHRQARPERSTSASPSSASAARAGGVPIVTRRRRRLARIARDCHGWPLTVSVGMRGDPSRRGWRTSACQVPSLRSGIPVPGVAVASLPRACSATRRMRRLLRAPAGRPPSFGARRERPHAMSDETGGAKRHHARGAGGIRRGPTIRSTVVKRAPVPGSADAALRTRPQD